MSQKTAIGWTEETWNPVRGCSRVSTGCMGCYAEAMAARFSDPGYWGHGYAERTKAGPRWTGKVELIPEKLAEPLSWRTPRKCFVNSTSDLFHERLPFEDIAAVYGVMAACPHVTFQVLTKRPERRREFFSSRFGLETCAATVAREAEHRAGIVWDSRGSEAHLYPNASPEAVKKRRAWRWPLSNVWEGTSVENQETADRRIPELLQTPAAIRFVSYEPALGPVDFTELCDGPDTSGGWTYRHWNALTGENWCDCQDIIEPAGSGPLHQIIVGGESGSNRRPFEVEWVRSTAEQCRAAGVACFVKQDAGPRPGMQGRIPEDLWAVKEFPSKSP